MEITLFSSGISELLLQLFPTTGHPANGIFKSDALQNVSIRCYNTLEGIAILHLLPHKVPARRWSLALITDGRTLSVVDVYFSNSVPFSIVLKR